jgi:hypothetical protein
MIRNATNLALLSITILPIFAQLREDLKRKSDEAERRIVRLSPTAFPELPRIVVRELQNRACAIPQVAGFHKRQNVIRGEFAKPGQTDWAVLCWVKGSLELYVFWNGSERNPVMVNKTALAERLPVPFEVVIAPVDRKYVMEHYQAYGGPKPPPIDHHGIEWGGEKASVVLYYYRGKWLTLQGAD